MVFLSFGVFQCLSAFRWEKSWTQFYFGLVALSFSSSDKGSKNYKIDTPNFKQNCEISGCTGGLWKEICADIKAVLCIAYSNQKCNV